MSKKIWTSHLNNPELVRKFKAMMAEGRGRVYIERELGLSRRIVCTLLEHFKEQSPDLAHQMELIRSRQKYADKANAVGKIVRSEVRFSNAIEELLAELNENLGRYEFHRPAARSAVPSKSKRWESRNPVGILQLADLHLNELVLAVDTAGYNESDYGKASARLKKHVLDSCTFFDAVGCHKVVVANTGDAINSDRRLDEILTNAGNRSRALIVAVDLIQQVLTELSEKYVVTYVTVGGNESRKYDEITWSSKTFGNNYDIDIHYMLQRLCGTNTRITFTSVQSSVEQIITINKKNILLVHGHQFKSNDIESSITKLYAKYAKAGILVNYVICGHVHCTMNSDFFSRSSSLVGDNAYSSGCLLLRGKAGQNIYIVTEDSIIPISIDLQETLPKDGEYPFDREFAEDTMQMKSRIKSESRIPINVITI